MKRRRLRPGAFPNDGLSNLRYEVVGEGFTDAAGRPTVAGKWYLRADRPADHAYGVILAGPFNAPRRFARSAYRAGRQL